MRESLLSPLWGSSAHLTATGGRATSRLAPGYFLLAPPGAKEESVQKWLNNYPKAVTMEMGLRPHFPHFPAERKHHEYQGAS
jgi:hypothetical protein